MDPQTARREAETPTQAGPGDMAEVVQTLSDAFAVDPHLDWFMRADPGRAAARHAFFRLLMGEGLAKGRIDRPAGGGAAAIWMPFEWLGPTPIIAELRSIPSMLRATGWRRFGRM